MSQNVCPQCGAPIDPGARECKFCGERFAQQQANQQYNQQQANQQYSQHPQINQPYNRQPQPNQPYNQQPNQQYNQQATQQRPMQPQPVYGQQPVPQAIYTTGINPAWPVKSKIAAGILAILLGGFGIHKFYLGKTGMGILYLVFCWTYIPAMVGFVEGIIYLCSNDENFQLKHHVRIG